jgi:hypothetical protein
MSVPLSLHEVLHILRNPAWNDAAAIERAQRTAADMLEEAERMMPAEATPEMVEAVSTVVSGYAAKLIWKKMRDMALIQHRVRHLTTRRD